MTAIAVSSAIFLLLLMTSSVKSQLECDTGNGWHNLDGQKCYRIFTGDHMRTYERAVAICDSYGSRLVTIKDQQENDRVAAKVMETVVASMTFYIGLSKVPPDDCDSCSELRWSDGRIASDCQGYWSDEQPGEGDCVYVKKNEVRYNYDRPYTWSYGTCLTKRSFVCERMAAPSGSFHCFSGDYVHQNKKCDGVQQCNDGSDELDCPNRCHYYHKGTSGDLSQFVYTNIQSCSWAIETPQGTNAVVEFTNFNTESGADFVDIYIGNVVEIKAMRVDRVSGSHSSLRYRSYNNMMLIKFTSDADVTGSGFSASYSSLSASTGPTIPLIARNQSQEYTLQPFAVGSTFLAQTDYVFKIETESKAYLGPMITLQINALNLGKDDMLMFFDGDNPSDPLLSTNCHEDTCTNYHTVYSTGHYMSILLRTYREITNNVAFRFTYRQGCFFSSTAKYGTIFTPGFPKGINYPNYVTCTWDINVAEPVTIYFDSASQLSDQDYNRVRNGDFLKMVVDGVAQNGSSTNGLTTSDISGQTFSSNGRIQLTLTTSPTRSSRGFLATWSKGCPNPNYDSNTQTSTPNTVFQYRDSMIISCATGYDFHQEQIQPGTTTVTLTCDYMGVWKNYRQIPRCTPKYCGTVPNIENGYIESSTGSTFGSVATYKCFQDTTLQPAVGATDSTITCLASGQWSASPSCIANRCPTGQISTTIQNGVGLGSGNSIGSIYTYECDAGYRIVGDPIIFCKEDGTWTQSSPPTCERLQCPVPAVKNGYYTGSNTMFFYGDILVAACNVGYEQKGDSQVECGADRQVIGTPSCESIMECETNPCDMICTETDNSFICSCEEGYQLLSNKRSCEDIDECLMNLDDCDDDCFNNDGGYTCGCRAPYVLFSADLTSGYKIPLGETGLLATDVYHLNHSCVLVDCPMPPTISNGDLLTKRTVHRYGDYIEYQCRIGYIPGRTTLRCGSDGNWVGTVPDCTVATCAEDSVLSIPLNRRASFVSGPYNYGYRLELNCSRPDGEFKRYRFCTYNPVSKSYEMQGQSYDCGEVDCGVPFQYEGTATYNYIGTTFGNSFEFACENGGRTGQTQSGSTSTVTCLADGYWDFGSLQCTGNSCLDPSFPAGGDIIATSFADKSEISFKCLKSGYSLTNNVTLTCSGTTFSGTVPDCVDTTDPVFSNCPTANLVVPKYGLLRNYLLPLNLGASDNTGIQQYFTNPSNANTTYNVENDLTLTYTAVDFASRSDVCQIAVQVQDVTPPTIQCPPLTNVLLDTEEDVDSITLDRNNFNIDDDRTVSSALEFGFVNQVTLSYGFTNIFQTFTYTAQVKDSSNNVAVCRGQIFVQPRSCSELSFLKPLQSTRECTFSNGVRTCQIECEDGYTFEDEKRKTIRCQNGVWDTDWIPACVLDTLKPKLTCPTASKIIYLSVDDDTQDIDFSIHESEIVIDDLNDIEAVTFSPNSYTFTRNDLYRRKTVQVTVTDKAGYFASCSMEYTVLPSPGSPLALPRTLNADVSCSRRIGTISVPAGYDCTITCLPGRILRNIGRTRTVQSFDGSDWNDDDIFPACITDTTRPVITSCPRSNVERLSTSSESRSITFATDPNYAGQYSDLNDLQEVLYQPAILRLTAGDLYSSKSVNMIVSDLAGNSAQCTFQVIVRPRECSELALPVPVNGVRTCQPESGGVVNCEITCNVGYSFYGTDQSSIQTSCTTSNPTFNTYVPACVRNDDSVQKQYIVTFTYDYKRANSDVTPIENSCLTYYEQQVEDKFTRMESRVYGGCDNLFGPLVNLNLDFLRDSTMATLFDSDSKVRIQYEFTMTSPDTSQYPKCVTSFNSSISQTENTYPLSENIPGNQLFCPELDWTGSAQIIKHGFFCNMPYFESKTSDQCLRCPAGTTSDSVNCNICPVNTYNDGTQNSCQPCSDGFITRTPGATSSAQCVAPCTNGQISDTGYSPCYPCAKGTYWTSSQTCTPCGGGQTTSSTGATSAAQCITTPVVAPEPCGLGTQDTGNNVCELCPIGTLRSSAFQASCVSCTNTFESTVVKGAVSAAQCYSKCSSGFVSDDGLVPCRACPRNEYQLNSTTCARCSDGLMTLTSGSVSSDCVPENNFRVKCPRGTERNSTTGNCVKCPVGFYSRFEESTCQRCPSNQGTYFPGATSSDMCRSQCPPGFFSSTGLSPCTPCGLNKYSTTFGVTQCSSCQAAQITLTTTSSSVADCKDPCPAGTFSYNGYNNNGNGCTACPANYYQSNTASTSCTRCPSETSSTTTSATSSSVCQSAAALCTGRCQQGTCEIRNNEPVCSCPQGSYYGSRCENSVNLCLSNPCYNGGECQQTVGGYSCDCKGLATGDRCQTIVKTCDTSQTNPTCKNGGHCINYPGSTKCLCRSGYSGTNCQTKTDICVTSDCDSTGSVGCMDVSNDSDLRFICECKAGYTGEKCEINIDECEPNPCLNGAVCLDAINDFVCQCKSGYSGKYCQTRTNTCNNFNCGNSDDNRATCVDNYDIDQPQCLCNTGYSYDDAGFIQYDLMIGQVPSSYTSTTPTLGLTTHADCQQRCNDVSTCTGFSFDTTKCYIWNFGTNFGALSTVTFDTYKKTVVYPDDDFWSRRYPILGNSVSAAVSSLQNYHIAFCYLYQRLETRCCRKGEACPLNSECNQIVFNDRTNYEIQFKCSVNQVFNRNTCARKTDYCSNSPCQNGGSCTSVFGTYRCSCTSAYTGFNCQTNVDECATNPCGNGRCIDGIGSYTCQCDLGYQGTNCNSRINYCIGETCNNRGQCENLLGGYRCNCNAGFTGKDCQTQILFCDPNPCTHGTCQNEVNGYLCTCDEGWMGENCDVLVDYCNRPQDGQQCKATCKNIFKGYYCDCSDNTYGTNCEFQPQPCSDYNKCLNNGLCSYINATMSCQCPASHTGDGCEIEIDYCGMTNPCQNGAECRVTSTSYKCLCAEGYQGALCDQMINYCDGVSCPGGQCINLRNRHYCRCALGKTGADCNRDYDRNYDLYFNHPQGYGFAWIPFHLEVNADVISVAIWVRYSVNNGNGVYMTQFVGDSLASASKLLEFDEEGLTVYVPGQAMQRIPYGLTRFVNNGEWHHVVVTYSLLDGTVTLYMDTVKCGQLSKTSLQGAGQPMSMWVVLGCEFDNENHRCDMNGNNFHGYLSQVNWYKRELTFDGIPRGDISENYHNPRQVLYPLSDLFLVWNEYVLESGVTQVFPSEASRFKCDVANRQPPCNFYTVSNVPSVRSCPSDITVYSPSRTATVRWTEPEFDNLGQGQITPPTRSSGSTFDWGIHDIIYLAEDDSGNKAYCSFRIYVQASDCESPPNPFGGLQDCSIDPISKRKCCEISCPSGVNSYTIDRVHPELFTCGPLGSWNDAKPFAKFRYPACGEIQSVPRTSVYIRVTYNLRSSACDAVRGTIRANTRNKLVVLRGIFSGTLCQQPDCSDAVIMITCGSDIQPVSRRKRGALPEDYAVLMEIFINGTDASTTLDGETITLEQFLTYFIIGEDVFDYSTTVAGGAIEPENYFIQTTPTCPAGEVLMDGSCVECGPGNYYKLDGSGMAYCEDCPIGFYQTLAGQSECTSCSLGLTTELTGNFEAGACKTSCPKGQYFDNTQDTCMLCPVGYYQDEEGQFRCKHCGAGYTTKDEGSESVSACSTSCDHGYQLDSAGNCEPCPIGEYRNASLSRACMSCPAGKITEDIASKSESECSLVACLAGNYRDVNSNTCKKCALNTYQPDKWQTRCIDCEAQHRTEELGSTKLSDCLFYCESGYEVIPGTKSCRICPVGTYKDNAVDIQGMCKPCDGNYRTPGTGSTSESACSIYKCEVGYYPNAANDDCLPCELGRYQDIPYSTSCKVCPTGTSTRNIASNSSALCESYCPSGEEKRSGNCVRCDKGSYKDNADGLFGMCQACNSLYTTASDGSTKADDCSIRTCPAGTKRTADDTGCELCGFGFYQPEPYQLSCIQCPQTPQATSTRRENSTSLSDCETYCDSGSEKVGTSCNQCDIGYYKDNNDGLFAECTLCPSQFITDNMGSTSSSLCTVANCSAGTFRDTDNSCKNCPKGSYQDQKWQTRCIECGTDKTTENTGADEEKDCILECSQGYEDVGGICQKCPIGFYKPETIAAACTPCPSGFITNDTGTITRDLCNIPACQPGQYLDTSNPAALTCRLCPYDKYQDQKWQESCISCPSGRPVTLQTGANSVSRCVLDCLSGQQYVSDATGGTCQLCEIGYYRDKTDRSQAQCQLCGIDKITSNVGSQSSADCRIANCTEPGTYRDAGLNICKDCPIGKYQNQKWQITCIDCPAGNSTKNTGSTSIDDCKSICPLGEYVGLNNRCEQCAKGYYMSDPDADTCTKCPNDFDTPTLGSVSESSCSISPCVAGQKYVMNDRKCVECETGTYQPEDGKFQCIDCPTTIKYTPNTGATSAEECKSTCQAGEQFNVATGACEKCPMGTYQPQQFQFTCISCPSGRMYSNLGATSSSQCFSHCAPQANSDCSVNATCALSSVNSRGYTCSCFAGYEDIGQLPGRECAHTCDRGYCKNGATCTRGEQPECVCSEWYTGTRCESRVRAEDLSDNQMDIIIPAAIGGGGALLLLIILAVCCLFWRRANKPSSRPQQYSEFNGDRVEKVSVQSYNQPLYAPSVMMLAPGHEVMYDNQAYKSDLDRSTSFSEPAIYQA